MFPEMPEMSMPEMEYFDPYESMGDVDYPIAPNPLELVYGDDMPKPFAPMMSPMMSPMMMPGMMMPGMMMPGIMMPPPVPILVAAAGGGPACPGQSPARPAGWPAPRPIRQAHQRWRRRWRHSRSPRQFAWVCWGQEGRHNASGGA